MKEKKIDFPILVAGLFFCAAFLLNSCGDSAQTQTGQAGTGYHPAISYGAHFNTFINTNPDDPTVSSTADFTFSCSKKKCSYKCKLDKQAWGKCASPKNYSGLLFGSHTFQVKAKNAVTRSWDPTPARYTWVRRYTAVAVSAGNSHTCALTDTGGVWCWGLNSDGQLGDGTSADSTILVGVSGLSSGISDISAGYWHTCALTTGGGVKCWGFNDSGQLGVVTGDRSKVPVDVTGLSSGVSAIAGGGYHTCALTTTGAVWCWGADSSGQLGDNANSSSVLPVAVTSLSAGVTAIAAGFTHTCAVASGAVVKCWGANTYGELGDGTNTDSNVPVNVSGLSGVSAVAGGYDHTCALTTAGAAKCWGYNFYGHLGNGTNTDSNVPVNVNGMASGIAMISAGYDHTSAVTTAGAGKCWGWNEKGELGNGNNTDTNVPVNVSDLSTGLSKMSAGRRYTCGLISGGRLMCWGLNDDGQLGTGTNNDSNVPGFVFAFGP